MGKVRFWECWARGSDADRIVIGMVGERGREVQEFLERALGEVGFARSVVVVATSDRPAAQRVAAAWTATAIAEAFRDQGENVLLLIDSVTRFAMAQRELGLAAGEPPTTRGYPPSVFNLLPRLVERAGRTDRGSITAFYSVLVEGEMTRMSRLQTLFGVCSMVISFSVVIWAAAHIGRLSMFCKVLSRLQPHLVAPHDLKVAAAARQHLAEYRRHADLISIGAYRQGSDPKVDAAIAMRDPLNMFLQQEASQITPLPDSNRMLAQLIGTQAVNSSVNGGVSRRPPA